jgi:hypothetical protein
LREINGEIKNCQRILTLVQRYEEQHKQQKKVKGRRESRVKILLKSRLRKVKSQTRIKLLKKKIEDLVDR